MLERGTELGLAPLVVPPQCRGTWIAACAAMTRRRASVGGAREGCWRWRPVAAVEQGRGWGGTWMAGCTWWMMCGLTPRPPLQHLERGSKLAGPPVVPPQCRGEDEAGANIGRQSCPGLWIGGICVVVVRAEWVDRVRGLAGVRGKPSWSQPGLAGRQGDGGVRHGTQTVLTRRLGRNGRGYVSTRCPRGGTRTVMPRRAQGGAVWVAHDPAARRAARQTVLTRRLGRWWPGVRQHPVPSWRHSDGHAKAPRARRRGVAHDPVPEGRHADGH